jgi:hypothetical protein
MDYILAQMDHGSRWLWLLDELDSAADSRKVYGGVPTRTDFVGSQSTVAALVQHYATALEGKTYVCQGLSGSGKTTSALYLMHGDINIRPRRAIMIRASDSKDLATSFSSSLGAPDAARIIHRLLVRALVPKDKREPAARVALNSYYDWVVAKLRSAKCYSSGFETELRRIRMRSQHVRQTVFLRTNCVDLPLLIIDGLVESNENSDFVGALYEAVVESKITVLIFVKEETWANQLIKLNGGTQILPVDQVITNPRQDVRRPFTDIPQWTGMLWSLQDIEAFAEMENINDVDLHKGMTPQQVLDAHQMATRLQGEIQDGQDGS